MARIGIVGLCVLAVGAAADNFEASFTIDSLSADDSSWLNEGTLGSSIDITSLTGSVRSEKNNVDGDMEALCFDSSQTGVTWIDYDINQGVRPDLTMETWFRPDQYANGRNWILAHDDGSFDRAIMVYDARFGGLAMGVGTSYSSTLGIPTIGEWIHLVVTYTASGQATLYLNGGTLAGGSEQSRSISRSSDSSRTNMGLNSAPWSNHYVVGCFAQIQMTNRALTAEEVKALYDDFDAVINAVPTEKPTTSQPTSVPTMEPTKNCDLLHIDEFLLDCSLEWDAAGNTRTAMQSSIDTNAAGIVTATTSIASNAANISTNAADIVAVKSTADSNAADVTAVESSVSALESRVKELEDILEQIGVNSAARSAVFQAVDDAKMVKGVSNGVTVTGKDLGIVALAAINVIMIVIMVIACKGSGRRTKYQPVAVGSDMEPINA